MTTRQERTCSPNDVACLVERGLAIGIWWICFKQAKSCHVARSCAEFELKQRPKKRGFFLRRRFDFFCVALLCDFVCQSQEVFSLGFYAGTKGAPTVGNHQYQALRSVSAWHNEMKD